MTLQKLQTAIENIDRAVSNLQELRHKGLRYETSKKLSQTITDLLLLKYLLTTNQ